MTIAILTDPPSHQRFAVQPLLEKAQQESAGTALMTAPNAVSAFERMVSDPTVDAEKFERFLQMKERIDRRDAEMAFNAAMATAQQAMRPVAADATNPQTKSRYASYEALDRALRPIYTDKGFALSFNTGDEVREDQVRVLCDVTHLAGHSKLYKIDMPADGKGAKGGDVMTKTHATGSAVSYGMRYLLKMIFNVAVTEDDDDGNKAAHTAPARQAPAGYQDWLDSMTAVADEGTAKLEAAWKQSRPQFRAYVTETNPRGWAAIKAKAESVMAR